MRQLLAVIPKVGRPATASYVSKTTELFEWRSHPNLVKAPTGPRESQRALDTTERQRRRPCEKAEIGMRCIENLGWKGGRP